MRSFFALTLVALLLVSRGAAADAKAQARARPISKEGVELYHDGKYAEAIERFERSNALFDAPQNHIFIGRANDKLGHLVLARGAYERAQQIHFGGEPRSFEKAREIAASELEKLKPRIPWLEINVSGDDLPVTVTVDGVAVPQSEWKRWEVDPGSHKLIAQVGDRPPVESEVTATEGRAQPVTINVPAEEQAAPPPPVVVEKEKSPLLLFSGLGFGVGGVGLVLGAVTGGLAVSKVSDIEDRCGDAACPPELREEQGEARSLAVVSNVGFIVGSVGVATGVGLLIYALIIDDTAESAIVPVIGPGVAGVSVAF